jgi:hypothetical protein
VRLRAVALLLIATACSHAPTAPSAPIGTPFRIGVGPTVRLQSGDVELGFDEVLEDSRCPADAICIWAGRARLKAWLRVNGARREIELQTDTPQPLRVDGFEFDVQALEPFPVSNVRIDKRGYVATLVVARR